jgi:hypothetical protein
MDDKPQDSSQPQPPQRLTPLPKRNTGEELAIGEIERQDKVTRLQTNDDFEVPYDPPKKPHKFLRKLLHFFGWLLLTAIITGAIGGAAWYYWLKDEPKSTTSDTSDEQSKTPTPAPVAEPDPTETYTSSAFQLQFDYPEGWKVTEGADNKIIGVSTATKFKTVSGGTQTGQVLFTIQHKQASLPDFTSGNALAVYESEKVDYAKPSQTQRASTYISFLNYAASTTKGLDGIYVTGDNGYKKDQYVPLVDVSKSDPLITLTFRSCDDDKCATPGKPLTISANAWGDTGFAKPLRTMLQSIIVQ